MPGTAIENAAAFARFAAATNFAIGAD